MRTYEKLTIDCEDGYLTIVEGGQQDFAMFVIEDRHGGETVINLSEENLEEIYQFIKEILWQTKSLKSKSTTSV